MKAEDLYLKLTDPSGKAAPVINYHRVWDRELFVNKQTAFYGGQREYADVRLVAVVSEAEYLASRRTK